MDRERIVAIVMVLANLAAGMELVAKVRHLLQEQDPTADYVAEPLARTPSVVPRGPPGRGRAAGVLLLRYTLGAQRAQREAGFPLLLEFPELGREYTAPDLFPLFRNRVINPRRPERDHYLRSMDLGPDADPIEICPRAAATA